MILTINLTPRATAWIKQKVQTTASDPATVAARIVEKAAGREPDCVQTRDTTPEERLRRFRKWVKTVPSWVGLAIETGRTCVYE